MHITCDVTLWYHSVISQLCDIIAKRLWYHMWNHRQQRDTSYVISHSFFHIICDITCDITVWYHMWCHIISHCDVICDVTSLSLAQAPGPPWPSPVVQPPKMLHSSQQPAWNGPEKSDHWHVQKRNGPDKPDQRHPKNQILCHWNCPMKNFNWIKVLNLGRTWRWLCRPWLDEANCDMQRIIGSAETS